MAVQDTAAVWSAVAAAAATAAAFFSWRTQVRALEVSTRPDLLITDWIEIQPARTSDTLEIIRFKTVRNVGVGSAISLFASCWTTGDNRAPLVTMGTFFVTAIPPGESADVDGTICIDWQQHRTNLLSEAKIRVNLHCTDTLGRTHLTSFHFIAWNPERRRSLASSAAPAVLPGILAFSRTSRDRSPWAMRMRHLLARIPGFRRLAREPSC